MSATTTFHFACDVCGKRADVEQEHPNQRAYPDGWRSSESYRYYGDLCSEACARSALVARAVEEAARLFIPAEAAATPSKD